MSEHRGTETADEYRRLFPDLPEAVFEPLAFERLAPAEMRARAAEVFAELDRRRTTRDFSPDPVPRELIELAIRSAGTAPSGAHRQPWTFVAVSDAALKAQIREATESEEHHTYTERMPRRALHRRRASHGARDPHAYAEPDEVSRRAARPTEE